MNYLSQVPSLEELKKKCFKQNIDPTLKERYKKSFAVYYTLYVTHYLSIRIVWFLYNTKISPNLVTFFSIIIAFVGAAFFSYGSKTSCLIGALLFELFYVLDAVDGQLARAKNLSSLGGKYLDQFCNFLVFPSVLFGIGVGVLKSNHSQFNYYSIWLACYGILVIQIIELLYSYIINNEEVFEKKNGKVDSLKPSSSLCVSSLSLPRMIYSFLYRSCTMPVTMNIITVASVANLFFKRNLFEFIVIYLAIIGTVVWLSKLIYISRLSVLPEGKS